MKIFIKVKINNIYQHIGTPFAQTIQALNTIESDLQKTVYVFVVSTKARGTSDFTGLENCEFAKRHCKLSCKLLSL